MEIRVRNVNEALRRGVVSLVSESAYGDALLVETRGSRTLEFGEPVTTIYDFPCQRVLFSTVRDANPFLHFFESLWMLQGRQDVGFLKHFTSRMVEFSDDGERFNGAYGWRWRNEFGFDQLAVLADLLEHDPSSRRAVLTMWQAGDLRYKVKSSKDVPCNTQVYFKMRDGRLNMTVCNRSNDMIWGAYGANAVHFSMLQEYMANKMGFSVGRMFQHSDSLHVYLPPHPGGNVWHKLEAENGQGMRDLYAGGAVRPYPLGAHDPEWDTDLRKFFAMADHELANPDMAPLTPDYKTPFFYEVVEAMWWCHSMYKRGNIKDAIGGMEQCLASDWRLAGREWLERRVK